MRSIDQKICLWTTIVCGAFVVLAFFLFPGFMPPMSPTMPPDQVAAFFKENTTNIRISMVIFNMMNVMFAPLFVVAAVQMKRMATPSPALAYAYAGCISSVCVLFAVSDLMWLVAAYRPERNPELVVMLNDMAWIFFVSPVGLFAAMCGFLATNIFLDAKPAPILPRWVAWFNIAVAAATVPSAASAAVHTGPFAWDGAISFYLRWSAFALYVIVMFLVLNAAIRRQDEAGEMIS